MSICFVSIFQTPNYSEFFFFLLWRRIYEVLHLSKNHAVRKKVPLRCFKTLGLWIVKLSTMKTCVHSTEEQNNVRSSQTRYLIKRFIKQNKYLASLFVESQFLMSAKVNKFQTLNYFHMEETVVLKLLKSCCSDKIMRRNCIKKCY